MKSIGVKSSGVKSSGMKSVGVISVVALPGVSRLCLENENPPSTLWWEQNTCQRRGYIKAGDTLVLSLPPHEHQYPRGNTLIYAYGPHSYPGDTHVSGEDT